MRRSTYLGVVALAAMMYPINDAKAVPLANCANAMSLNDNSALLPYLSFSTDTSFVPANRLPQTQSITLSQFKGKQGYTRLRVTFAGCDNPRRKYHDERREWVNRLLAGKAVSKVLSIKVNLGSPPASTIHPIASVGRESSRKAGETWKTEVSNTLWLTPYFKVDEKSSANVDINLKASTDYTSSVATDVLDLLKRATTLINPTSTLITTLNKDRFNDAAGFVDSSINSFFKQSVEERSVNDFLVNGGGKVLGVLYLSLPAANDTLEESTPVGVWVISTDDLIASIFQPSNLSGTLDTTDLSASSVLNFKVTPERSIEEALNADNGVQLARDAFLKASKGTDVEAQAVTLCQAVANAGEKMNLTPIDVASILWAYPQSLPLDRGAVAYGKLAQSCGGGPPSSVNINAVN